MRRVSSCLTWVAQNPFVFRLNGSDSFSMNPHGDGKPEAKDPDQVLRLLELELAQSRTKREQAGSPYRGFRMASFIFLFAVAAGALFAFYYVFVSGGLDEFRGRGAARPTATPATHTP